MKSKFLVIVIFLVVLFRSSCINAEINENNDFQVWLATAFSKKITQKIRLFIEQEVRYGDGGSVAYLKYIQARPLISLSKRVEIAPGYRQEWILQVEERNWVRAYHPFLDVHLLASLGKWSLDDRNRIQYLIHEGKRPNIFTYRNRLFFVSPWFIGKMRLNPWFSDELFVTSHVGISQNRFLVGGTFALCEDVHASLAYMLRFQKFDLDGGWRHHKSFYGQLSFVF